MLCLNCDHRYHPAQGELTCPICDSAQVKIISGQEFLLESIDVE
jgi:Zn finger protein HypA/HybF involved in hydrogenase expression